MKKIDTLYLIDDDAVFQFLTQKVIEATDSVNEIKFFSNGLDAIDFIKSALDDKEKLPELILLDLFMPLMDGWQFLEEFVQLQPKLGKKIPIYIISSSIDPADIKRAKAINAVSDFIIKPITKEKFLSTMSNLSQSA